MDSEVKETINELDKERTEEHNKVALILATFLHLPSQHDLPRVQGSRSHGLVFAGVAKGSVSAAQAFMEQGIHEPCGQIGHRGRDLGPCDVVIPAV